MNRKKKTTANKTLRQKKDLLKALEKCKCIVTDACKLVGVSRTTYYDYYKNDEDFKNAADDLANVALDFAESKLFEKMEGVTMGKESDGEVTTYKIPPSDTALIFYLKTKGKKRGYIEKTEIDLQQNKIEFILPKGYED
jgi:hypothetical protein